MCGAGRRCQYIYMPVNDDSKANAQSGAIKVDVGSSSRDVVGRLSFGDCCFGGELIFVPRQQDPTALQGRLATRLGMLGSFWVSFKGVWPATPPAACSISRVHAVSVR